MATAELATCLPVLALLLAVAISAVSLTGQCVRVQDAAREAARAAARGDDAMAERLAHQYAPGVAMTITTSDGEVRVVARLRAHPIARWLPPITITERAVSALEPDADAPDPAPDVSSGTPP